MQSLTTELLYTSCDPDQFAFEDTNQLEAVDVVINQPRALDSVRFGLRMRSDGYNIFALGPSGMGKFTAIRHMVKEEAKEQPVPPDWCYVNNFNQPHQPNAMELPAGRGRQFQQDMAQLIEELSSAIPAAFDSEDYQMQIEELEQELKERQSAAIEVLGERAKQQRIALMHTPSGFAFAPMNDADEVLKSDQYNKLSAAEQQEIEKGIESLQQDLQKTVRQFPIWAKETREKIKQINREIAEFAVSHLIDVLKEQYGDVGEIIDYLAAVQFDIVENVSAFLPQQENPFATMVQGNRANRLQRYRVNLLVDNSELASAPVIFEDLPSHTNLIGRVEYQAQMGTLVTDFTLIKPGALHRANGGYLVLDMRQVLMQPFAWDSLKRALQAQEIRLDSLERTLSLTNTVSLEPEHIPLDVKVVLVGDRLLYYLLCEYDPDFLDLFKVMADFDEVIQRNSENDLLYARLFGTLARQNKLLPLDRFAVARLIEQAARLADDAEKTTTHLRSLADLLCEADYWAKFENRQVINQEDIQKAIDQQIYRAQRLREHIYENIYRDTILIDTKGHKVGQINGLSVLKMGGFTFGQPTRITATTRLGDGKIIDIERETELGGPIHSKGVMILSSFLGARYAHEKPLSMAASLVFEQSYGMVEGDSASLAELCALLSSLADLPIQQHWAITGSVNQLGQVQPIGGVNEKIEGFFAICSRRGLNGKQGVIIPAANIKHLMLHHEVIAAVTAERFRIHAVETVDQAIELLTQVPAGVKDEQGSFTIDSVNYQVEACLHNLSELRRDFARNGEHKGQCR